MALNVELLESFAQVNSLEVTKRYTLLFTDYPEVQPLFANTHMEKQGKQLFQSLVPLMRKPDALSDALTRHVQYGVSNGRQ